jgi:hypothetical protein
VVIAQYGDEVQSRWRAKYLAARRFMAARAGRERVLIEVAAQHPLTGGLRPNEEFRARLDRGSELFHRYGGGDRFCEIYVPGSRHVFEGQADRISLSEAGRTYLAEHGVPAGAIRGDDLNIKYKGDDGVYGSADECFVAASYYRDGEFGTLVSVCSPAQMIRKTLHYIEFGVLPLNFTAPVADGFHDYLNELFVQVPQVLGVDARVQGDSAEAKRLRAERKPPP